MTSPAERLIVALDVDTFDDAARLIERLPSELAWYKIGSKLFTREGPRVCGLVREAGAKLFLDLKFHDIPNTVYGAVRSALDLDCDMLTLHASGGGEMLRRAREAAIDAGRPDVILLAVTVLTSFGEGDFSAMFASPRTAADQVVALAAMAHQAGANGVVASAREVRSIRERLGDGVTVVTPGIRLPGAGQDDQARVVTPEAAVADGADYIVVGRPVIAASDPAAACREIFSRLAGS